MPEVAVSAGNDVLANPMLPSRRVSLPAGTVFFEPGNTAENLCYIHRGQVRVYQVAADQSSQLIEILGPGDWFGVDALASTPVHSVRAVAVTAAVVSQIPAERLANHLMQQPRGALELMKQLASKLRQAREDAARLIFDDCEHRLLKTLLRFGHSAAATVDGPIVTLHITHQQLAQAIGVARETVSLALGQLRMRKCLRTGRNQLTFEPEVLQKLLEPQETTANAQVA